MNKKQALRFFSFCTLAFIMIFGIGQFFRDKDTTLASFYSEPKNTIDTIIVGSSHVNSAIVPAVFWREQGINAHNVFSWSQPIWISYYYIKDALRLQRPRTVILDLYGMMYGNSREQPKEIDDVNYRNSFSIDTSNIFLQMIGTVNDCGIDLKNPIDFLNVIRYHTGWKNISKDNFIKNSHNEYSFLKNYGVQSGVYPVEKIDISVKAQARAPYDTAIKYLDKIVELSKKEDFKLIFTMLPYQYMPQEREIFAWLADYSLQNNIPFINYCEGAADAIGFDFAKHFADAGHTNFHGAQLLSADLARLAASLKDNIASPPNAQLLNEDANKTYRVFEVNDAVNKNPTEYFKYLQNDENLIIYANLGQNAKIESPLKELLPLINLDANEQGVFKIENNAKTILNSGDTEHNLVFTNTADKVGIKFKDKNFFTKDSKQLFCVYDKILQRPTFYFRYDSALGELKIKDFPAK